MKALITGGAGFIGSHLTDRLVKEGYEVTILDDLSSTNGQIPDYINLQAEFIKGDIRDKGLIKKLVPDFPVIFHEAASVGIAQSNYEITGFVDNNCLGIANLLQAIIDSGTKPKLIVSTSNTTYGEGLYSCRSHGNYHPLIRSSTDVERFGFDPVCPECKKPGNPAPTPEETSLDCNSIYALTKKFQEESAICIAKLYEFPAVLLKYFNVFGPRQSLSNPYTGVSAIFTSAIKQGKRPLVYEDGLQSRDFISIHDVVEANVLAMKSQKADYQTFNVGSGRLITIKYLAEEISHLFGKQVELEISGKFRKGDIRHCVADYSKIDKTLGWQPKVSFEEGLEEIITWSKTQESSSDTGRAQRELELRRLV